MAKIGLFYGSDTGNTERVAQQVYETLNHMEAGLVEMFDIAHSTPEQIAQYDYLIFGIPTWNIGQLQEDWDKFWPRLDEIDFTGKKVAIFGLGDLYTYANTFLDALGMLAYKVKEHGGELVGEWPAADYQVSNLLAMDGDHFMGLALDEDNESHLTQSRLDIWIPQVLAAFGIPVEQLETLTETLSPVN